MKTVRVNDSDKILPIYDHTIAIVVATSGFSANGVKIELKENQHLSFGQSPFLVAGAVEQAKPGTIFYYYRRGTKI